MAVFPGLPARDTGVPAQYYEHLFTSQHMNYINTNYKILPTIVECGCGSTYNRIGGWRKHRKTKKHKRFLEDNVDDIIVDEVGDCPV